MSLRSHEIGVPFLTKGGLRGTSSELYGGFNRGQRGEHKERGFWLRRDFERFEGAWMKVGSSNLSKSPSRNPLQ